MKKRRKPRKCVGDVIFQRLEEFLVVQFIKEKELR